MFMLVILALMRLNKEDEFKYNMTAQCMSVDTNQ